MQWVYSDKPGLTWRHVGMVLLFNAAIGFVLCLLNFAYNPQARNSDFGLYLLANMIYAQLIGCTAAFTIPWLAVRIWRLPKVAMWMVYLVALIAVAAVGTMLAVGGLLVAGIIGAGQFWPQFVGSVRTATLITIIVGIASFVIETLRHRVEHTTLELKTAATGARTGAEAGAGGPAEFAAVADCSRTSFSTRSTRFCR
ncbi:MAG: hypothetical protein QM757_22800 [Paludibaculum sp.]